MTSSLSPAPTAGACSATEDSTFRQCKSRLSTTTLRGNEGGVKEGRCKVLKRSNGVLKKGNVVL